MVTLPFTVGVFMVRAWVPGGGEETVGRMTGLLVRRRPRRLRFSASRRGGN
jgi:hypothetical protein